MDDPPAGDNMSASGQTAGTGTSMQKLRNIAGAMLGLLLAVGLAAGPALASPERWKAEGWTTDFSRSSVDLGEIISGGPPKDGIPSIDDPKFVRVSQVTDLADVEPVIGLEVNGEAKAYPIRILMWHEIVNDEIGGVPVAVTFCPLCNAALVFDRRVGSQTLEFGTTGKLRHSDLVMYDRTSESWWQQFSGEAIVGAALGKKLALLPSRLESWANFRKRRPDARVLVPSSGSARLYGRNPYERYDSARLPFLYQGDLPDNVPAMSRVVIVRRSAGEAPVIVSLQMLREKGALERGGYRISWEKGQASALDAGEIARGRDVGNVLVQKDGRDVPYDVTFAFVAHAFHPQVPIETN